MPTYDYQCNTCGRVFEHFQSMSSTPLELCPTNICEQEQKGLGNVTRKIGSGAGLIFNGSGFYGTDYKAPQPQPSKNTQTTSATPSSTPSTSDAGSSSATSPASPNSTSE